MGFSGFYNSHTDSDEKEKQRKARGSRISEEMNILRQHMVWKKEMCVSLASSCFSFLFSPPSLTAVLLQD